MRAIQRSGRQYVHAQDDAEGSIRARYRRVRPGTLTLRGVVETFRQRHAAIDDVRQIEGVSGIDDQLEVKLGPMDRREDDEIRAAALQALIRDSEVPTESIDVSVRDGWVTLTGYVEYEPQRIAAFDRVATLDGVMGVSNEIKPLGY